MKNTVKFFGIIALAAIIAFSMTSCDTGVGDTGVGGGGGGVGGGGGNGGLAQFGETLVVNNVQVRHYNEQGNLVNFTGNLELYECCCLEGEMEGGITGGRLSFSIGRPNRSDPIEQILEYLRDDGWTNVSSNNPAAYFFHLWAFQTTPFGWLSRDRWTETSEESVSYIWVSHAVTITGTGRAIDHVCDCSNCDCEEWDGDCYCEGRETLSNLNLVLAEGWNALHHRVAGSQTAWTTTISVSDPGNVQWIWWDSDGGGVGGGGGGGASPSPGPGNEGYCGCGDIYCDRYDDCYYFCVYDDGCGRSDCNCR